ncbi:MAG: ABC transporter substrate-binding protein [Variibacter sp.]|nr:ABC transporter substrate-binding protein [Variibacter sp.]
MRSLHSSVGGTGRAIARRRLIVAALAGALAYPACAHATARHAIAMHGEPALPEGFDHFPYVNPAAPKGGRLTLAMLGTFDSLNPFIVNGLPLQEVRGYVVESLLVRGYDEPFTLYGLLARSVETDSARSYVTFTLDPAARFSDGTPVTPEDVVFSWALLREKGRPNHRAYYSKVARAEIVGPRSVRFDFGGAADRELPLILGLMPVLAKHATDPEAFERTSFVAPLGSGPYVVAEVAPGERVTLKRNPHYWGRDLAVNRGLWNFDEIRFDFYRDANAQFEAFKKGLCDVRAESDAARWETGYDIPAVRDGRIVKETFATGVPQGMSGFVFNTRRTLFADVRVREAIAMLFDFDWVNRNFFFGHYRRIDSYFAGSELSSHGRAADATERALLAPFPGAVRPDILAGAWSPPASDGSGRDRKGLRRALALLAQAGWEIEGTELRDRTGRPFAFEILVTTKDQERLALVFQRDLKRAGITARVRLVDAVQYDRRRQTYDFDMLQYEWGVSLSPGNEQSFYWGAAAADTPGTRNYMGLKSAAVDAMIEAMLAARDRPSFVAATRALDRVLLSGFYVVPLFYAPTQWVARWSHIRRPQATSLHGYLPETWWREPQPQ